MTASLTPVEAITREIERLNELIVCYEGAYADHVSDMRKLVAALELAKADADLQEHLAMLEPYGMGMEWHDKKEALYQALQAARMKTYEALQK